jgi:hypothetical protein
MKLLLFGLLLPLLSAGQTIHFEEDKIVYKGSVNLALSTKDAILERLQTALPAVSKKSIDSLRFHKTDSGLQAFAQIKLKTPYHLIRRVNFAFQLTPREGGYDYQVDSVSLIDGRRGWKQTTKPAAELLEGLEETGLAEIETEILLNEIDLRIQKVLKILENQMRVPDPEGRGKDTSSASGNSATAAQ